MHNCVRDVVYSACGNAGVVAVTEAPGMLPHGNQRPADVLAVGLGDRGEDLVVDVCIYDPLAGLAALSLVQTVMRRAKVAHSAAEAERMKRRKKPQGQPNAPPMEQRVSAIGKTFYPIAFETFGATTTQCTMLLKKTQSESAREEGPRQGDDPAVLDGGDRYVSGEARSGGGAVARLCAFRGESGRPPGRAPRRRPARCARCRSL